MPFAFVSEYLRRDDRASVEMSLIQQWRTHRAQPYNHKAITKHRHRSLLKQHKRVVLRSPAARSAEGHATVEGYATRVCARGRGLQGAGFAGGRVCRGQGLQGAGFAGHEGSSAPHGEGDDGALRGGRELLARLRQHVGRRVVTQAACSIVYGHAYGCAGHAQYSYTSYGGQVY